MTAYNPKTQENFKGQYTGVRGANKYDVAQTKAILIGDKGTVLDVNMEIEPGLKPRGIGNAIDNNGVKYQIQF